MTERNNDYDHLPCGSECEKRLAKEKAEKKAEKERTKLEKERAREVEEQAKGAKEQAKGKKAAKNSEMHFIKRKDGRRGFGTSYKNYGREAEPAEGMKKSKSVASSTTLQGEGSNTENPENQQSDNEVEYGKDGFEVEYDKDGYVIDRV